MAKGKERKMIIFWPQILGLVILGLGLLARNTIVILMGIVLFVIFWMKSRGVKGAGKADKAKRARGQKKGTKGRDVGSAGDVGDVGDVRDVGDVNDSSDSSVSSDSSNSSNSSDSAMSGPVGVGEGKDDEIDEYNLEEELKAWEEGE